MKNIFRLAVLAMLVNIVGCSPKIYPSTQISYVSETDGAITIRSTGLGSNAATATDDAQLKAINELLFRGLPSSNQKTPLLGTDETGIKAEHQSYFDSFYGAKRYKSFINSSAQVNNFYKGTLELNVQINLRALRADMEENQLIRKFGY